MSWLRGLTELMELDTGMRTNGGTYALAARRRQLLEQAERPTDFHGVICPCGRHPSTFIEAFLWRS